MDERRSPAGVALLALLALPFLNGCSREPTDPQWDVDLAIPLVNATLTMGDLIADSLLVSDEAGNLSIVHSTRLFALRLDTVFTAPDTSFRYAYGSPFGVPVELQPGTAFPPNNSVTRFDLEELELRLLRIRSGMLFMDVTSEINGNVLAAFSLPGATYNNAPVLLEQTVPPGTQAAPSFVSTSRDLAGHAFDLRGPQQDDVNTLATNLTYSTDPTGSVVTVNPQDSIVALIRYVDLVPAYATGFFGTRTVHIDPASSELDLFNNISGVLDLDEVNATLRVSNGIGVDARVHIDHLRSVNGTTNNTVDLQHAITTGAVNLDRALDMGNGPDPAENTFLLNGANSNVEAFVENLPDRIEYEMDITIAPLGDVSNGHDFFYYESEMIADLEVEIPLRLIATDLTLSRTVDVDLPGSAEGHAIRSGTLHLFATNGFPFSAGLRLEIVDGLDQLVSSITPGGTVASGTLAPDGTVSAPANSTLHFELSAEQMTRLHEHGRVRITAVFNTADQQQHVRILSSYQLAFQLSAEGNYLINGDD